MKLSFLQGILAGGSLASKASFFLPQRPLRRRLKISTEADYLQAHITVIAGAPLGGNSTLHSFKELVVSALKRRF